MQARILDELFQNKFLANQNLLISKQINSSKNLKSKLGIRLGIIG